MPGPGQLPNVTQSRPAAKCNTNVTQARVGRVQTYQNDETAAKCNTPYMELMNHPPGPKIGPKSGPDFWKTGPERDLGPDAPVFRPNGAMATQNNPNFIFGKPNLGVCWTYFAQFAGNRGIMGPNGEAKKMRAEK